MAAGSISSINQRKSVKTGDLVRAQLASFSALRLFRERPFRVNRRIVRPFMPQRSKHQPCGAAGGALQHGDAIHGVEGDVAIGPSASIPIDQIGGRGIATR
jgi:hypothetical protein